MKETAASTVAAVRSETDRSLWLDGWPRLVRTLGASLDLDELCERVCRDVVEGFGFSRALIATVDERHQRLVARAGYDPKLPVQLYMALFRLFRVPLAPEPDGRLLVAAWCVEHQRQAYVPDAGRDSFRPEEATQRPFIIRALGTSEYVVTPVVHQGRTVAVLGIDKKGRGSFRESELGLLRDVAELLSLRLGPLVRAEAEQSQGRRRAAREAAADQATGVEWDLLDSFEEGLLVIGADHRIRHANRAAGSLLGFTASEMAGSPLDHVLRAANPRSLSDLLAGASDRTRTLTTRQRLVNTDGAELDVRLRVVPLDARNGAHALLIRPAAAQTGSGLRDESLRAALHDLLAPLQSIIGFAELMQLGRGGELTPEQAEFVSRIVAGGDELIEFVHRLLLATALESGSERPGSEPVLPAELIDRVFERLDGKALRAHVRLVRELGDSLPAVRGNPTHLAAVFQNLVDNAIDAIEPGGTVRVRGFDHDQPGFARFAVSQERGERSAGRQPGAFEEDWSRRGAGRRRRSHGLGLSIVRRVVEAHGGELWAEGELDDELSITFTLPLHTGPDAQSPTAARTS